MNAITFLTIIVLVFSCQTALAQTDWCEYGRLPTPVETRTLLSELIPADYTLAVFYVVPHGIPYEDNVYKRIIKSTLDIQAWYQCATGGRTWKLAFPETVRIYYADQTRDYYENNGNWWGSLLGEMQSKGHPIWSGGTVSALWARGAGWWAGGLQWCGGECGVCLLGVELFPEFNNSEWSGGQCPVEVGVAAWPCTPEGAFAHELGHTLGLPHPIDVPGTEAYAYHSVMQAHWDFPNYAPPSESPWGFLTLERQEIHSNPFMHLNIDLFQFYPDCDVVNLPPNGPVPHADFELVTNGLSISGKNRSTDSTLNYWTWGDGSVSNDMNPVYNYYKPGAYWVSLRISNDNAMMDLLDVEVILGNNTYVSNDGSCNGNHPCFPRIQNGIASVSGPSVIKITQETYNEDILLNVNQVIVFEGGWDTHFTSCSSSTIVNGSMTITDGTVVLGGTGSIILEWSQ